MKLLSGIDLHVVAICLIAIPPALIFLPPYWEILPPVLFPQGRIFTRFMDLRSSKRPTTGHLIANELFVVLVVAAHLGVYALTAE